jgi:hypothetical protein
MNLLHAKGLFGGGKIVYFDTWPALSRTRTLVSGYLYPVLPAAQELLHCSFAHNWTDLLHPHASWHVRRANMRASYNDTYKLHLSRVYNR